MKEDGFGYPLAVFVHIYTVFVIEEFNQLPDERVSIHAAVSFFILNAAHEKSRT
jgi:hypothetical protein